jgi:hypothetical protein
LPPAALPCNEKTGCSCKILAIFLHHGSEGSE